MFPCASVATQSAVDGQAIAVSSPPGSIIAGVLHVHVAAAAFAQPINAMAMTNSMITGRLMPWSLPQ